MRERACCDLRPCPFLRHPPPPRRAAVLGTTSGFCSFPAQRPPLKGTHEAVSKPPRGPGNGDPDRAASLVDPPRSGMSNGPQWRDRVPRRAATSNPRNDDRVTMWHWRQMRTHASRALVERLTPPRRSWRPEGGTGFLGDLKPSGRTVRSEPGLATPVSWGTDPAAAATTTRNRGCRASSVLSRRSTVSPPLR